MDYCDQPEEVKKNPQAKQFMVKIANGNDQAFRFMWAFWNFMHLYDDLVDRDKMVSVDDAAKTVCAFVTDLTFNPFYQENKAFLHPLIVQGCNRWIEGDLLEQSNSQEDMIRAEVVRCGDVDLFMHVAYLVGGWSHMRACAEARTYDKNQ